MKNIFSPGLIISLLGLGGLTYAFVDTGGLGSKLPIVLFFFVITVIGLVYEAIPKEYLEDKFGETSSGGYR